jgi:hypothetical protein
MTQRTTIVGNRPVFSETAVLDAIGTELLAIKTQDRLTWDDMAAVLGVSDVQAAKYVDGSAKMSIVAFARAKREWNGRFTGTLDRLCADTRPGHLSDHAAQSSILKAALALSVALEDGQVDPEEVRANRATLECARDAIEAQLAKLVKAA